MSLGMKLTSKSEYAIKALVELAVDYGRGNTATLINDVARRKDIPQKYLEQILLSLKNAGILVSKRGVGGGYSLSRPPENISLSEIFRAVEGSLAPAICVSTEAGARCPEQDTCGLYGIMLTVKNAVSGILDNTSLKDVARRAMELADQKNGALNYTI